MMTVIKKCLKLCKYGYQLKTNIITGLIFLVLGLIWVFMNSGYNCLLGIYYLLLVPLFSVQVSYNLLFSNMTLSSSMRKTLDCALPNMMGVLASVFAFGMTYVGLLVNPKMRTGTMADSGNMMIASGIAIAAVMIYYGAAFKFFIAGMIVFFLVFIGILGTSGFLVEFAQPTSLLMGSIIGILIAVAGNVLGCIIRAAVYKYSMDPLAGGNSLRKAMK